MERTRKGKKKGGKETKKGGKRWVARAQNVLAA